jgi:hypothetical protein
MITSNKRLKQADDADTLLTALRRWVQEGNDPIKGYSFAAQMIGRGSKEGVHVGQVCSRIDLACFNAGLPMLTMHWVRLPSGAVNAASLNGWHDFQDELLAQSSVHRWTEADFDRVRGQLDALPNRSALTLWRQIESRGIQFARQQLHRNVAAPQPMKVFAEADSGSADDH